MKTGNRFTDRDYLKNEQYRDDSNLRARISLHERYSTNPLGLHVWVFNQLDLLATAAILEAGCGPGDLWHNNRQRIPQGWRLLLSDLSPGMVRKARRRLRDAGNFSFASFDITHAPLPAATFDAVIANHMLYHVPNVSRALATIHRLLKPDGVLYAVTNGRSHLREIAGFVSQARGDQAVEADKIFQRSIKNFTLQSGYDQLLAHFAAVELRPYPDSLTVDDAEPIVQYVASSTLLGLSTAGLARLRTLLQEQLRLHGVITITKESGLFIARKSGQI